MKNKIKKITYLVLWVVGGVLVTILLAGIIEAVSYWIYGELELIAILYGVMVVVGMLIGLTCGPIAWQKIYVDGFRGKKYVVK
jgi:hypothetical protein